MILLQLSFENMLQSFNLIILRFYFIFKCMDTRYVGSFDWFDILSMKDTYFDFQSFDLLLLGAIEIMKFVLQIFNQVLIVFRILFMSGIISRTLLGQLPVLFSYSINYFFHFFELD